MYNLMKASLISVFAFRQINLIALCTCTLKFLLECFTTDYIQIKYNTTTYCELIKVSSKSKKLLFKCIVRKINQLKHVKVFSWCLR